MPSVSLSARRITAGVARASSAAVLLSAAACGLPTSVPDSPIIDTRWIVPSQSVRFGVDNLLPSTVTIIVPDSSGFNINAAAASITRTLSQDCSACVALNGLTAPKPAFVAIANAITSLPSEITGGTFSGGSLQVVVTNNYGFDPLRPNPTAGSPNGYAIITISSGNSVIGRDSVNGATLALPSGTTLTRTIPVSGPFTGTVPLSIAMSLSSPSGEPRFIDASKTLTVTSTPSGLKVANVSISITNKSILSTATTDLSGFDSKLTDRVKSGALIVSLANPFTVAGPLTVRLTPEGGTSILKTVPLIESNSTPAPIPFTSAELRSLLGKKVTIAYSGIVNSTTPVNVSPKQVIVVTTKLDLAIQLGGGS